jgi:hypothetical protein
LHRRGSRRSYSSSSSCFSWFRWSLTCRGESNLGGTDRDPSRSPARRHRAPLLPPSHRFKALATAEHSGRQRTPRPKVCAAGDNNRWPSFQKPGSGIRTSLCSELWIAYCPFMEQFHRHHARLERQSLRTLPHRRTESKWFCLLDWSTFVLRRFASGSCFRARRLYDK